MKMRRNSMRLRIIVRGRVQGVGYRFFTQRTALELGIKGYVRNLPDGTVEVVAEGSPGAMEKFIQELREGPPLAIVEDMEVQEIPPDEEFETFEVRY